MSSRGPRNVAAGATAPKAVGGRETDHHRTSDHRTSDHRTSDRRTSDRPARGHGLETHGLDTHSQPARTVSECGSAGRCPTSDNGIGKRGRRRPMLGLAVATAVAVSLGVVHDVSSDSAPAAHATGHDDPKLVPHRSWVCLAPAVGQPGDIAVVNITNTDATGRTWGALRPSGDKPVYGRDNNEQYSSVNAAPGPPNPNLAFVRIDEDGRICYDQGPSSAAVILDQFGLLPADTTTPLEPTRLLDTRTRTGSKLVAANTSTCIAPATGQPGDIAVVNITNTDATGRTWGALRPSDDTPVYQRDKNEQYSSVNTAPGPPNPNLAFVEIGTDGRICYDQGPAATAVILDQFGLLPADTTTPLEPTRLLDTRTWTRQTAGVYVPESERPSVPRLWLVGDSGFTSKSSSFCLQYLPEQSRSLIDRSKSDWLLILTLVRDRNGNGLIDPVHTSPDDEVEFDCEVVDILTGNRFAYDY